MQIRIDGAHRLPGGLRRTQRDPDYLNGSQVSIRMYFVGGTVWISRAAATEIPIVCFTATRTLPIQEYGFCCWWPFHIRLLKHAAVKMRVRHHSKTTPGPDHIADFIAFQNRRSSDPSLMPIERMTCWGGWQSGKLSSKLAALVCRFPQQPISHLRWEMSKRNKTD